MHTRCAPRGLQTGLASGKKMPAYPTSGFMDETVKKICEKHGLDKNIVGEIINSGSVKDETKRLKKINSLLEKL